MGKKEGCGVGICYEMRTCVLDFGMGCFAASLTGDQTHECCARSRDGLRPQRH